MAQAAPQTFANHVRIVPAYHIVLFGILVINFIWAAYQTVRLFSVASAIGLLLAIGLIILSFCARIFALRVQDRVIRLEMWLRMEKLLPADLRGRIPEFTVSQLVALRFASDEELPELARKILGDNITDRKTIKKMIQNWKPDYLRA